MVKSKGEVWFDIGVYALLTLLALSVIFPLLYVVSVSLTPLAEVLRNGGFVVFPKKLTLDAYAAFIHDPTIPRAYGVTIFITVVGTLLNLMVTTMMAYPLSKSRLPGRNLLLFLVAFTLLFNGGVVPTYLVVKATGLINSLWSLIVPSLVWSFNLLIMKTFFENLPDSLDEAARIDGAGELRILSQIVLPLSLPIMATIGLFYAVGHWNEFFQAIMYVNDTSKFPLQVVLKTILINSMLPPMDITSVLPTQSLQMAAVVLSALPIIVVYPFIQKYFTQGVLLGGIKG
ncbi:carbohydrate ABC transporter permease [Paenibacillus whitsoniae]|uniref:Carbohydrate ABC transporter permease n=1 Tax=Paenibacillus whitsoniae TaxID=2496558 RepID=A0A3S0CYM5_9BACL|nr:carbohydrate ABC transporter permease [Paenibacillus whitsoniae]RTE11782.1 carbohydrate ABC transporter permease [Paenibacillus whitsoniae]